MNFFYQAKATVLTAAILTAFTLNGAALPASAQQPADPGLKVFEQLQDHIVTVSKQVKNTVVHIEVMAKRGDQHRKGLGSGLIISGDGKIVTNYHVIDRAQSITVILDDKTKYEATLLRSDQQTDLALIKINAPTPLPFSTLSDSDKIKVGQWVIAIGNPYGFDQTVSFGIVSGKGRFIPGVDNGVPLINDFIQTDALIDPGNSGGPLVSMDGQVVGINSVGIGRGQGFTIPANIVKQMLSRSEVAGRIQRGWLGAYVQVFNEEYAEYLGIPNVHGILISDTSPGSPAAKAGMRSGDILTKFNGIEINANNDEAINRFILLVSTLEPHAKATATIYRQGRYLELPVTVGTQPTLQAQEADTPFGISVKEITATEQQEYRLDNTHGVLVTRVVKGSAASEAGIEAGDILKKIEADSIVSFDSYKQAISALGKKKRFLITLQRGLVTRYALVDLAPYRDAEQEQK